MQITEEQLIRFKKLYKDEFGIELTDAEAQGRALSLLRFLAISVVPFPEDKRKE